MDFVTRLKQFLDLKQIPVTQFADNCRIPRPTLSQLLNGRNKKVSDEVIGKIHEAYPTLSVLWLMFGEGKMENTSAPAPRVEATLPFDNDKQPAKSTYRFDDMFANEDTDLVRTDAASMPDTMTHTTIQFPEAAGDQPSAPDAATQSQPTADENDCEATEVTFTKLPPIAGTKKRIVNIIVYYDDNSFEAFVPDSH